MPVTRMWWITLVLTGLVACGPKSAEDRPAPTQEFICGGRGSVGEIRERVEAATRDEALEKFKQKHTDVTVPVCTPNPGR